MERHVLTLVSVIVHVIDLCPRKALCRCSIFYLLVNSLHAAWALHQVLPKLLCPSICIELMVTFAPTIPQVNPLLSLICIELMVAFAPPLDLVMHPPMYYLIRNHTMALSHSVR
ncbi:hypothetical protein BHE74_00033431 [Ensete ventricosum]|nr:hypothetical protein BHE74_00033431 [Ensete ventricosum]